VKDDESISVNINFQHQDPMVKTAVKNGFQDSRSAFIEIKGRGFDQI
jgi:hypothetical protein